MTRIPRLAILAVALAAFSFNVGCHLFHHNVEPGTLKWRYQTDDHVSSSPTVGVDSTVYVGSEDGYLYAIQGSAPLADSPWPRFHHDNRNSGRVGGP